MVIGTTPNVSCTKKSYSSKLDLLRVNKGRTHKAVRNKNFAMKYLSQKYVSGFIFLVRPLGRTPG